MEETELKNWLMIGSCIFIVFLLVLGSFSNVVGYTMTQSSNKEIINEDINQTELFFQTIIDIINNKEIQRIIFKSQITRGIFPHPDVKFSVTKNQLKQIYFIGLVFSKIISKSSIYQKIKTYQKNTQRIQKQINAVIEHDIILNEKINQVSNSVCDCENKNTVLRRFPVICSILFPMVIWSICVHLLFGDLALGNSLLLVIYFILGSTLHCFWI